jgi:hypothetical protein
VHHNYWESAAVARVWRDLGFLVDVVDNDHPDFVPTRAYDFLVASRIRLEMLARQLNPDCVKVLHVDTAHWLFSNAATHQRALDLQRRRGVTLTKLLEIDRNRALEVTDCAMALGNDRTVDTYAYADKPIYRLPSKSTPRMFDWPEDRNWETARRRFVSFRSASRTMAPRCLPSRSCACRWMYEERELSPRPILGPSPGSWRATGGAPRGRVAGGRRALDRVVDGADLRATGVGNLDLSEPQQVNPSESS